MSLRNAKVFLVLAIVLSGISSNANAVDESLSIHSSDQTVHGISSDTRIGQNGDLLSQSEFVTIEAEFGNEAALETAIEKAGQVLDAMKASAGSDPVTTVAIDVADPEIQSTSRLNAMKNRFLEAQQARIKHTVELTKQKKDALLQFAKNPRPFAIQAATATANYAGNIPGRMRNNVYKSSITLLKLVSATGATVIATVFVIGEQAVPGIWGAVQHVTTLPALVAGPLIASALPTGLMSAAMLAFSDKYSSFIVNPMVFHKVDSNAIEPLLRKILRRPNLELSMRPGLYLDQLIKSIVFFEFPFVFISKLSTMGPSAAVEAIPHIVPDVLEGGFAQTFFDQASVFVHDYRELKIMEKYPPGAVRDAKLRHLRAYRDSFQTANSLFQVWMVLLSTSGSTTASVGLRIYLWSSVFARAVTVPLENKLFFLKKDTDGRICSFAFGIAG